MNVDPTAYAGCKFRKYFPGYGWFSGEINEIWTDDNENLFFHAVYEDNDQEDLSPVELQRVLEASEASIVGGRKEMTSPNGKRRCIPDLWQIINITPDVKERGLETIRAAIPQTFEECAEQVAHFFLFMLERQRIWERHSTGQKKPYTESQVLQNYFFCNVSC